MQDFRKVACPPALPQFLFEEKQAYFGQGLEFPPLVMQIQKIINVGVPQHHYSESESSDDGSDSESEKFQSKYLEDAPKQAKKKKYCAPSQRLYKYLLTDGKTEVIALEIEAIRDIEILKTLPGTKIRLYGPIEVRRGIWLLKRANVELLWHNIAIKDLVGPQTFEKANQLILGQQPMDETPDHGEMLEKLEETLTS
jgi:hypothetical protein